MMFKNLVITFWLGVLLQMPVAGEAGWFDFLTGKKNPALKKSANKSPLQLTQSVEHKTYSQLLNAIRTGDVKTIRQIAEQDVLDLSGLRYYDVDITTPEGELIEHYGSPLSYAVSRAWGKHKLSKTAEAAMVDIVKALLDYRPKPWIQYHPKWLHDSPQHNSSRVLPGNSPYFIVTSGFHLWWRSTDDANKLKIFKLLQSHASEPEKMLLYDPDTGKLVDSTVLHVATWHMNHDLIKYIITSDLVPVDAKDGKGDTALQTAFNRLIDDSLIHFYSHNIDVIKTLIQQGADGNLKDDEGRNLLMNYFVRTAAQDYAKFHESSFQNYHIEYLRRLFSVVMGESEVGVNDTDANGDTLLHLCMSPDIKILPFNRFKLARILLDLGADPKIKNKKGRSALNVYQALKRDIKQNGYLENGYYRDSLSEMYKKTRLAREKVIEKQQRWLKRLEFTVNTNKTIKSTALHKIINRAHHPNYRKKLQKRDVMEQLTAMLKNINIETTNEVGQTALELAVLNKDFDIAELLVSKGAKPGAWFLDVLFLEPKQLEWQLGRLDTEWKQLIKAKTGRNFLVEDIVSRVTQFDDLNLDLKRWQVIKGHAPNLDARHIDNLLLDAPNQAWRDFSTKKAYVQAMAEVVEMPIYNVDKKTGDTTLMRWLRKVKVNYHSTEWTEFLLAQPGASVLHVNKKGENAYDLAVKKLQYADQNKDGSYDSAHLLGIVKFLQLAIKDKKNCTRMLQSSS